jgi:cation diffusion facilitator family transporter
MSDAKSRAALLSVTSNTLLVGGKLAVGLAIGSVSVMSEAAHSGMDLIAALIAFVAVRTAARPADRDHAFGHGKVENLSGAIEALLILAAAIWIVVEAVDRLRHPAPLDATLLGVGVMGLSAVVNLAVSGHLFRVARATGSVALLADAWHLRTDVWTSAGVLAGLLVIEVGRFLVPGVALGWLDPVVALAVALLITKAAWDLTRDAARDLLDEAFPADEQAWLLEYIGSFHPVVRSVHRLRTRRAGPARFVDFHLAVDPAMTVEASHGLSERLQVGIEGRFPGCSVVVHVEPCAGQCPEACLQGCLIPPGERPTT